MKLFLNVPEKVVFMNCAWLSQGRLSQDCVDISHTRPWRYAGKGVTRLCCYQSNQTLKICRVGCHKMGLQSFTPDNEDTQGRLSKIVLISANPDTGICREGCHKIVLQSVITYT